MKDGFEIEVGVSETVVRLKKKGAKPGTFPFFASVMGAILCLVGIGSILAGSFVFAGFEVLLGVGMMRWGFTNAPKVGNSTHHVIHLSALGDLKVDQTSMDTETLKMTFNEERIVFRDSNQMLELWHTIVDLERRMDLRETLESALKAAALRHGQGADEVPHHLRAVSSSSVE